MTVNAYDNKNMKDTELFYVSVLWYQDSGNNHLPQNVTLSSNYSVYTPFFI